MDKKKEIFDSDPDLRRRSAVEAFGCSEEHSERKKMKNSHGAVNDERIERSERQSEKDANRRTNFCPAPVDSEEALKREGCVSWATYELVLAHNELLARKNETLVEENKRFKQANENFALKDSLLHVSLEETKEKLKQSQQHNLYLQQKYCCSTDESKKLIEEAATSLERARKERDDVLALYQKSVDGVIGIRAGQQSQMESITADKNEAERETEELSRVKFHAREELTKMRKLLDENVIKLEAVIEENKKLREEIEKMRMGGENSEVRHAAGKQGTNECDIEAAQLKKMLAQKENEINTIKRAHEQALLATKAEAERTLNCEKLRTNSIVFAAEFHKKKASDSEAAMKKAEAKNASLVNENSVLKKQMATMERSVNDALTAVLEKREEIVNFFKEKEKFLMEREKWSQERNNLFALLDNGNTNFRIIREDLNTVFQSVRPDAILSLNPHDRLHESLQRLTHYSFYGDVFVPVSTQTTPTATISSLVQVQTSGPQTTTDQPPPRSDT